MSQLTTYSQYKLSGLDYLGEIPAHWEVKKLKFLSESILSGGTPDTSNAKFWDGELPWVSPKDMKSDLISDSQDYVTELAVQESSTALVPEKSVLVVVRSGILKHTLPVGLTTREVTINQDIKAFIPNELVQGEYLAVLLKGFQNEILTYCSKIGATVDSIEMDWFLNFQFAVPPLTEQRAIVAYLDEKTAQIDALIQQKEELLDLLAKRRQAVISEAVTQGLDPLAPRRASGIEWLGEIPAHWEVKKLKYVSENHDGKRVPLNGEERTGKEGPYPYFGANGIVDHIDEYIFDGKYVLVGEDGAPFFIPGRDVAWVASGKFWVNNHAHILEADESIILPEILSHQLNIVDYKHYISGSTRDKLTQKDLSAIAIAIPPLAEQHAIAAYLDEKTAQIDQVVVLTRDQITTLRAYRQAVISDVVTGKVRVPALETA